MTRPKFFLFQSHLELAHHYWSLLIKKGSRVIDATCGNGHDALKLARLALAENAGSLLCIDIQEQAIASAKKHLEESLPAELIRGVTFLCGSHESFPSGLDEIDLIVYNLGYLPGAGNKDVTTTTESTIKSIENGLSILKHGGAISIMCYPGHTEGAREEEALIRFTSKLPPEDFFICHHRLLNRNKAPSLLFIFKRLSCF